MDTTVLMTPRRLVVVRAKLGALAVWAGLLAVLCAGTALTVGRLVLSGDLVSGQTLALLAARTPASSCAARCWEAPPSCCGPRCRPSRS